MTLAEAHQLITKLGDVVAFLQQAHGAVERTEATRSALARECQVLEARKAEALKAVEGAERAAAEATRTANAEEKRLRDAKAALTKFLRDRLGSLDA